MDKGLYFHILHDCFFSIFGCLNPRKLQNNSVSQNLCIQPWKSKIFWNFPKCSSKNHNTGFELKQKILWTIKCSYTVNNTRAWKRSVTQPVLLWPSSHPSPFPVSAASALQPLLQPLISAAQFTYRNAWSKSQAGLWFIFKKILVFSASCNLQLPGNMAKRCCHQITEVTTWDSYKISPGF